MILHSCFEDEPVKGFPSMTCLASSAKSTLYQRKSRYEILSVRGASCLIPGFGSICVLCSECTESYKSQMKKVREIFSHTLDTYHIGCTDNKCAIIGYLDDTNLRQMQADAFQPPYPAKSRQGSTNATKPVMIPWSKKPSELPEPCPVGLSGMSICSRTLCTI